MLATCGLPVRVTFVWVLGLLTCSFDFGNIRMTAKYAFGSFGKVPMLLFRFLLHNEADGT